MQTERSAWNPKDTAQIYHMIMWGYRGKDISQKLIIVIPNRTRMAVEAQVSSVRKWVSKLHDYKVSNYDLSTTTEAIFNKASQIPPDESILCFKRNMPFRPVGVRVESEVTDLIQIPATYEQTTEPGILEVMEFAKKLGVKEVEFKGMKITY